MAFNLDNVTFFFWRKTEDNNWSAFPSDLDFYPLLHFISGGCSVYKEWAESYYEKEIDEGLLSVIFNSFIVNESQFRIINPELIFEALEEDILEILF